MKSNIILRLSSLVLFGLVLMTLASGCFSPLSNRAQLISAYESRAKGTLRSISSAEAAYRADKAVNPNGLFGTFDDLQKNQYIAMGYSLDNMIEEYKITWESDGKSYSIIATPSDTSKYRSLRSFAVTDDGIVRIFEPAKGNNKDDVKTWEDASL